MDRHSQKRKKIPKAMTIVRELYVVVDSIAAVENHKNDDLGAGGPQKIEHCVNYTNMGDIGGRIGCVAKLD